MQKVNKFDSFKLVQAVHVCVKMIIIILQQDKSEKNIINHWLRTEDKHLLVLVFSHFFQKF